MTDNKITKQEMLLKQQLAYGARFERFITNTEKLGAANLTFETIEARLELLEKYWAQALDGHKVLNLYALEFAYDEYFTKDMFSDFECQYTLAKSYLNGKMGQFLEAIQGNQQRIQVQQNFAGFQSMSSSTPKLKRPTFSGKQEEWETFKEAFTAMFKDDPNLMPNLKLQHLVSCLEGEAARRLANFKVTGANFDIAWQALCRRYDNKRLRLATQLNLLLNADLMNKRSVAEISRLLDTTAQCIRALKSLQRPVDHWDDWFIQLTVSKLDISTREDWEKSLEITDEFPVYSQLVTFLENRVKSIETARSNDHANNSSKSKPIYPKYTTVHHTSNALSVPTSSKPRAAEQCVLCKGVHYINYCPTFTQLSVASKRQTAKQLQLCFNCLRKQHNSNNCPSKYRCKTCGLMHHSLLHEGVAEGQDILASTSAHATNTIVKDTGMEVHSHTAVFGRNTLLSTAIIALIGKTGDQFLVRALIDPCSEGSFVTEKVAQSLRLAKSPLRLTVSGVGGQPTAQSSSTVHLSLISQIDTNFVLSFSAAVLPKLTQLLPRQQIERSSWPHLQGLQLADPNFDVPATIDCILGADVYALILLKGLRTGSPGSPIAQQTRLGWILTGPVTAMSCSNSTNAFTTTVSMEPSLSNQLRRFWEIEEAAPIKSIHTADGQACEQHFKETHSRDATGRYIVRLPFKEQPVLPGSRQVAIRRLTQIERHLQKDVQLNLAYSEFMKEYEDLGHMRKLTNDQALMMHASYIPHHAVLRPDSGKIRVVFDAAQVSGDHCLNDYLHQGPKLQADLIAVLMRWRFFRLAFTADIVKMFRQISVHPDDVKWQRIVWRLTPEDAISDYNLVTVTYGTACAPYLANRVLQQLAIDEGKRFPLGATIIQKNMYVDDALAGAHSIEDACETQQQLISLLATAGMKLDKWAANFTLSLPESSAAIRQEYHFEDEDNVSILGLRWMPKRDAFAYRVQSVALPEVLTKRIILSNIAKLYDPLGWLAPIIVRVKILLQQLWITGKDWDAPVDAITKASWVDYCLELHMLQNLSIPRWIGTSAQTHIILHGFSDASEKAYAATIYAVVKDATASQSTLLFAKSKVAPIKTISLPRLELCGALLLARLTFQITKEMDLTNATIHCWSDSQVVLAWLNNHPSNWKTFVANRTSEIITLLPNVTWRHVKSKDNPADLATRGLCPAQLVDNELWWHGPDWLLQDINRVPLVSEFATSIEKRSMSTGAFHAQPAASETILTRFSSWSKLLRTMSYVRRWRHPGLRALTYTTLSLSAAELRVTQTTIINMVQKETYSSEITRLRSSSKSLHGSTIRNLKPFIDDNGTLRVGGRLQLSYLPYEEKHPAILPGKHYLTELLIRHAHVVTMHGGPQLTQSYLQRAFWITSARTQIKSVVHKCVRCVRFQGRTLQQQMAPLPAVRVTPSRTFAHSGVDYAGPFPVRTGKGRGYKATKGYVAVFTCMVTRAVHLEIVSDYSSQAFLAAFDRFISRRGLCHTIYSDNGTTFRGADAELKRLFNEASEFSAEVAAAVANQGIKWLYNPPKAPHFGGLWEAAVKSFKHHLKRVLGDASLTFEEFATLTARFEACLNSRPLSAISSDPADITALTPGHFIIGAALKAPPEAPKLDERVGLTRWQTIINMRNHFWQRWRKEVMHELQQRVKWLNISATPQIGDLVLLTDDQQPPQHWPLARVLDIHPGPDGLVRVLTLKTANSTLTRPIHRVIHLPINDEASNAHSNDTDIAMAGGDEEIQ